MKHIFALMGLLVVLSAQAEAQRIDAVRGEPLVIATTKPPTAIEMFQVLLENAALPLRGTSCSSDDGDVRTLQHQLALMLGEGLEDRRHKVSITGQCKADRFEFTDGVKDIWRCDVNVIESTRKGSYIANSSMHFGITKEDWRLIPESLVCL